MAGDFNDRELQEKMIFQLNRIAIALEKLANATDLGFGNLLDKIGEK